MHGASFVLGAEREMQALSSLPRRESNTSRTLPACMNPLLPRTGGRIRKSRFSGQRLQRHLDPTLPVRSTGGCRETVADRFTGSIRILRKHETASDATPNGPGHRPPPFVETPTYRYRVLAASFRGDSDVPARMPSKVGAESGRSAPSLGSSTDN